jgi:phosphonate transport system substrate-binding protein
MRIMVLLDSRLSSGRSVRQLGIRVWFAVIAAGFVYNMVGVSASAAEYRLSMLPLFATEEVYSRIAPLAEYLKKTTGLNVVPTVASDFDEFGKQLASGAIQIGYENPFVYVKNSQAHEAIAMASADGTGNKFRGLIITRADSTIRKLTDLKGKKIAIVGKTSVGGFLSQNKTLLENGIQVQKDCTIIEATENKQENVIFSVYAGDVDAGFIRESAFAEVKDFVPAQQIRTLATTAWMPNWALSVSKTMPAEDKKKLQKAIETMPADSQVLKKMKVTKFELATDSDYNPIREAAQLQ